MPRIMARMTKSSVTILLLLMFATDLQSQSPPARTLQTPAQPNAENSKDLPLEPVGNFPPEPVLPQVTAAVSEILNLADSQADKGDFQRALKTRNEALDQARHSNPTDEAVALRGKGQDLFELEKYDEALAATIEAVEMFAKAHDTIGQVTTQVSFAARLLNKGMNRKAADEMLTKALKLGQVESVRPGRMYRWLRNAGSRLRAGSVTWSRSFYAAAFDLAQKYPQASEESGLSSDDLTTLAYETGDFAQAESRLRTNVALWTKLSEDATAHLADTSRQLSQADPANNLMVQGYRAQLHDLEGRRTYYQGNLAVGYIKLGNIGRQRGDSVAAQENFDTAISLLKTDGRQPRILSEAFQARATLKMEEGELSAAGDDLLEALRLSNEADAPSESNSSVSQLGKLAAQQGNFSSAQNFLRVAQADLDEEGSATDWAANKKILGETYALIGDKHLAGKTLGEALAVYEKYEMPLEIAGVKLVRGSYEVNESPEQDMKDLTDAREILSRFAPKSVAMAQLLVSIAYSFSMNQRDEQASALLNEAGEILQRSAPKNIGLSVVEHNLMNPIRRSGNLAEAEKLAFQSWERVRKSAPEYAGEDAGESYSARFASYGASLAWIQVARKKNDAAFITLERTRARGLVQLLAQRSDFDQQQWLAHKSALSARYSAEGDFAQATNARLVADRSLRTLQVRNASVLAIGEAEARSKERDQEALLAEARLAVSTAKADALWRGFVKQASTDETPIDLLKLQKSLPSGTVFLLFARDRDDLMVFGLRGGNSEVIVETIDTRKLLTPGPAPLVGWKPRPQKTLTPDSRKVLDGQAGDNDLALASGALPRPEPSPLVGWEKPRLLMDLTLGFREALDSDANDDDLALINAQGEVLFNSLFPGRLRSLVLNAERLVISPEGQLWTLPFAALVTGRSANHQPQYLGLLKPITYTQSLSLYLRVSNQPPYLKPGQKPVALVLGDPLFDLRQAATDPRNEVGSATQGESADQRETVWASLRSRNSPPPPLAYSRDEARSVGCLFGAAPLLGGEANEERLRKEIERADVIHLASHSVMTESASMASGILLSPPREDPRVGETDNDGVLQAWEIFSQLRLRAELVVLSACDTALGKNVRGEGIVGLSRAFQYAGARSLIASQWEVADQSTSALMLALYESLNAGKQKDEALRLAMVKVAAAKATTHPHYWAAFTLTGASNNLNLGGVSATGCR